MIIPWFDNGKSYYNIKKDVECELLHLRNGFQQCLNIGGECKERLEK